MSNIREQIKADHADIRIAVDALHSAFTQNPHADLINDPDSLVRDAMLRLIELGATERCYELDDRSYRDHWMDCEICQKRDPMAPADNWVD
jgi:hypothetical protein